MTSTHEGAFFYDPPWWSQIWHRLGFGHAHVERPDDAVVGFAPGYVICDTVIVLDWADRIRALISGKISSEVLTLTDVPVARARSISAVRILPPNHKVS